MAVDANKTKPECALGIHGPDIPIDFTAAFAFSLETCTTVGYTLPTGASFFEHCYGLQVAIYFQMATSLLFNAFLIAFFYNRLSRCETRATQLLFSEKAIIHMDEDGKLVLEVQVYDADARYPVVEAHARLYVVHPSSRSDCVEMRIVRPNDEFGSMLLTSVPSRVAHHIDIYSPIMPSEYRHRTNIMHSYGLNLREVDSYTGNRSGYKCPVCAEAYGTLEQLWNHIKYNQLMEKYSDMSGVDNTHLSLGTEKEFKQTHTIPSYEELQQFWNENQMEVIAVVEGIDPLASGTFQALQSYQKDDVVFGASFAKCFTDDNIVDFDLFHTVVMDEDANGITIDEKLLRISKMPNHCCTPMQSRSNVLSEGDFPKLPSFDDMLCDDRNGNETSIEVESIECSGTISFEQDEIESSAPQKDENQETDKISTSQNEGKNLEADAKNRMNEKDDKIEIDKDIPIVEST